MCAVSPNWMQSTYLIARAIVEGSKDRTIFSTRVSGVEKTLARESSPLAKLAHAEAPRQLHANGSTPTTLTMLLRAQQAPGERLAAMRAPWAVR